MATNVTRDHHNLRRNLKLNDNYISNDGGDEGISITDAGDITLSATGGDITMNDGTIPIFTFNAADSTFKIIDDGDNPDDFFQIDVEAKGVTTLSTVDDTSTEADLILSPDGGIILNPVGNNIQIQKGGADRGTFYLGGTDIFQIAAELNDLLRIRGSGTGGVEIDTTGSGDITIDSAGDIILDAAGGDITVLYADLIIPIDKKVIFGNTGEYIVGDDTDLDIVSSNHLNLSTARYIYLKDGVVTNVTFDFNGSTHNGLTIMGPVDHGDTFGIKVIDSGATTISTAENGGGSTAHLNIEADGHVEFDGCGVGFDKETAAFSTSPIDSDANDSTDVDFRLGNKFELTLTDDISGSSEFINLIFPATSGNFILVLIQGVADCTVANTGWVAYQSDGSTKALNNAGNDQADGRVRWAGGSAPTLSTSQYDVDIISIYWDADNETAFAVASLEF